MKKIITRKIAFQQKLKFYFTGKPCKVGHISERYTSNFNCLSCRDQYNDKHKEYRNTYYKSYYKNNKTIYHKINLKKNYDLTLEQYNELLEQQNHCCLICHVHQSKLRRKLAVDHSHKSGKIRGLLCTKCNTILGTFDDNIKLLESAIYYLKAKK